MVLFCHHWRRIVDMGSAGRGTPSRVRAAQGPSAATGRCGGGQTAEIAAAGSLQDLIGALSASGAAHPQSRPRQRRVARRLGVIANPLGRGLRRSLSASPLIMGNFRPPWVYRARNGAHELGKPADSVDDSGGISVAESQKGNPVTDSWAKPRADPVSGLVVLAEISRPASVLSAKVRMPHGDPSVC